MYAFLPLLKSYDALASHSLPAPSMHGVYDRQRVAKLCAKCTVLVYSTQVMHKLEHFFWPFGLEEDMVLMKGTIYKLPDDLLYP